MTTQIYRDHFLLTTAKVKSFEIYKKSSAFFSGQTHQNFLLPIAQSRSDDTLLTVDVIYGQNGKHGFLSKSRMGRYFTELSSLRDFAWYVPFCNPAVKTAG